MKNNKLCYSNDLNVIMNHKCVFWLLSKRLLILMIPNKYDTLRLPICIYLMAQEKRKSTEILLKLV